MPDKKHTDKEVIRQGNEDKSIAHDMDRKQEKNYPRPNEKDRQFDNQPEFNERTSGQKDEEAV
jgi:hypothetical protein